MRKDLLFVLLVSISFYASSQISVYPEIDTLKISDETKEKKYDSILSIKIKNELSEDIDVIGNKYAYWQYKRGEIAKAFSPLLYSIKYHSRDSIRLQKKYYKLGQFYYFNREYKKSLAAHRQCINRDFDSITTYKAYSEIGRCYFQLGNYDLSNRYYKIAQKGFLRKKDYSRYILSVINSSKTRDGIGTINARQENIESLLKADSIGTNLKISWLRKFQLKRAIGSYYTDYNSRDVNQGEKFLNQALDIVIQKNDSLRISEIYTDLGTLYNEINLYKAINYFDKASSFISDKNSYSNVIIYSNWGLANVKLNKINLGLEQQYKALELLTGYDFQNIDDSKKVKHLLQDYFQDSNLWVVLSNIAESYLKLYEKEKQPFHLNKSIYFFNLSDNIIDLHYATNQQTPSKLVWRKNATSLYSRALKACYLANDTETAFSFFEKNKSLILYEENAQSHILNNKDIPSELIKEASKVDSALLQEKRRVSTNISSRTLLSLVHRKEIIIDSIHTYDKGIANFSATDKLLSVSDIQKRLNEKEAIVEYQIPVDNSYGIYPNTANAYGILITKNTNLFFEISNLDTLRYKIDELTNKNTKPLRTIEEKNTYKQLSNEVYNRLFPKEIRDVISNKKITIIPDNYLSKIPFESLITSIDTTQDNYLIQTNEVSYKYSYTFHNNNKITTNRNGHSYAAFAPINYENSSLSPLVNSGKEVRSIASYFSGETYTHENATKASFYNELTKKSIIHLATHANANDSIAPWIAFNDQKIFLDEIHLTKNNAPLIVLSGCNTSLGEIKTGEGTMSLARGFFFGGTHSTVSSLWSIDDKSTSFLMEQFYKNLKQGENKSTALHNAKITYLNSHSGSELSPYYWSSLILLGDTSPIPSNNYTIYYILIGIALLIGVGLLSRKRKKANR